MAEWVSPMEYNKSMSNGTPSRSISRAASMKHAWRGLRVFISQPNARIHCFAALTVLVLGLWLGVSRMEWLSLTLAIGLVMAMEAMNTAVELVVDLASPEWHALARDAKDVAAAAVLLASIAALVTGLWVFTPYLLPR
jgi:diacylglycerol kinase